MIINKINKTTIINLYKLVTKKLSQTEIAGGLMVSDSAIRYIRFNENYEVCVKASLRLPPGVVVNGKIEQKDIILEAIIALRRMINITLSRKAEVVLSIASDAVYSQLFNLPKLAEKSFTEAANLNIQMISPTDINYSYHSYQVVGRSTSSAAAEYELLGAFINSSIVNEWTHVCSSAGFLPIAVEFKSLSVVRAVSLFTTIKTNEIALIIDISSEGMDIMIMKNGNLYFDHSYSWKFIQGEDKTISIDRFKQVLIAETSKVINFTISKFNGEVKHILINTEGIQDKIIDILKNEYPTISILTVSMPKKCASSLWLGAIGAAKRGLLSRSEDNLISLTPKSVLEEYRENQILALISLWRKIPIAVLCFLLISFGAGNLFIRNIKLSAEGYSFRTILPEESQELQTLTNKANTLNSLVTLVGGARGQENKVYPFIGQIFNLAHNIQITRLSFPGIDQPIMLGGNAASPSAAMQFQRRLDELPQVVDVSLPLASLITAPDGRTNFLMSFRITNLDF